MLAYYCSGLFIDAKGSSQKDLNELISFEYEISIASFYYCYFFSLSEWLDILLI